METMLECGFYPVGSCMQPLTTALIETALRDYIEPALGTDLLTAKTVKHIAIDGSSVTLTLVLGFPVAQYQTTLCDALIQHLKGATAATAVNIDLSWEITAKSTQGGVQAIPGVKNIIAVASGKGGVGKSTTAINLALALQQQGATVGILDADIYGPSQPTLLGTYQKPDSPDGKSLLPVMAHGLQSMSIGYLVDTESAMIWRGPMVSSALQQLVKDTQWRDVDYLIIDLPPGTGDIQLTLAQKIPVSGAVVITTPQDLALVDVKRACAMFEKVHIPILGIIENMSGYTCSHCGHHEAIFGEGGAHRMSQEHHLRLLAQLPLDSHIRKHSDNGLPYVLAEPDSDITARYHQAALQMSAQLSKQTRDYSKLFANIVVQPK